MFGQILLHLTVLALVLYESQLDHAPLCSHETMVASTPGLTSESDTAEAFVLEPEESYIDDSKIGRPGKNRLEIQRFVRVKNTIIVIRLFSRGRGKEWRLKQTIKLERPNYPHELELHFKDFNSDGRNDFTFVSAVAARGANEVRTLFTYDRNRDELVHIKNSENYPNMVYNKRLDCIDAWLFHGATTIVFLRIDGDRLREFASVDTGLEEVITVIGKDGREKVVRREKMKEGDIYTRHINFDPPEPYNF